VADDSHDTPLRAALAEATVRLAADAARLTDADVAAPSALPGWTRGHVLAHVHLNAEAFCGVLAAAAAGEPGRMYPGQQERDAAIEQAASRSAAAHVAALLDSAERLADAWQALAVQARAVAFTAPAGWWRRAADVPFFRWREVVLHHCDLYPPHVAPRSAVDLVAATALAGDLLASTCDAYLARDNVPPLEVTAVDLGRTWRVGEGGRHVRGTAAALAVWLTGRSDGDGLECDGVLPVLPPFA
jgi:maleylpyruvate isomerase